MLKLRASDLDLNDIKICMTLTRAELWRLDDWVRACPKQQGLWDVPSLHIPTLYLKWEPKI